MKQIQYRGASEAWKNAYSQPIKCRDSRIYLRMVSHWIDLHSDAFDDSIYHYWAESDRWSCEKRSTYHHRHRAIWKLGSKGKLTHAELHDCEIEEVKHELMLEPGRRMDRIASEYEDRLVFNRLVLDAGNEKTYKPFRMPPDFRRYKDDALGWGDEWVKVVDRIEALLPYVLGSENAKLIDMLGEELRLEALRRDRIASIENLTRDWQIVDEIMSLSVRHAESAIYKIETGQPIGARKKVDHSGKSSQKTDENEDRAIAENDGLVGYKKLIEIGSSSKEDAIQVARLAAMGEWFRIKDSYSSQRKIEKNFVESNRALRMHLARVSYRAAIKDLTNWDGWREAKWLVKGDSETLKKEIEEVESPIESSDEYYKRHDEIEDRLDHIASVKGMLKTPAGRFHHANFKEMISQFLQGKNPNKRSNHLNDALRRYGIEENTWLNRRKSKLERWIQYHTDMGNSDRANQLKREWGEVKTPKSLASFLCNLPTVDSPSK